jgi:toxin ParE1/3/4
MSRFRLTEHAQSDLHQIWEYIGIEKDNPKAADRLMEKFFQQMSLLGTQPRIGQSRDEWSPDLRIFPVGNYVILYYPGDDEIEVIGIVYGRRDLPALFQRGRRRPDT